MITYVGHFIGHRAFAFIIVGTRRIPATTTYKLSSLYSHYTLFLVINASLCFNVYQTNHHGHDPSQQAHLLSPALFGLRMKKADSSLLFFDSATGEKQFMISYSLESFIIKCPGTALSNITF